MTDHKFTDDEIIKALECCDENDCYLCCYRIGGIDCRDRMQRDALALINRQKAEIERLIKANNRDDLQHKYCNLIGDVLVCSKSLEDYNKFRKSFKAEAIKEFAWRLKNLLTPYPEGQFLEEVSSSEIDFLVKEMTEEKDESQNT